MAKEIKIPQIAEGVESATVSEILVAKGDKIEQDQGVIAVESDKASVEVPSSAAGTVKEIKISEGDEVEVGQVIILLEDDQEQEENASPDGSGDQEEGRKKENDKQKADEKDQAGSEEEEKNKQEDSASEEKSDSEEESDQQQEKDTGKEEDKEQPEKVDKAEAETGNNTIHASPGTRRVARELGVDLYKMAEKISGRISEKDVREFAKSDGEKSAKTSGTAMPDFEKWGPVERQPLNNIKKATAKNVSASWQSIPHVFQFDEADITSVEKYLESNQEKAEKAGGKLTITALLTKIVAGALLQFPRFNASVDMESQEMILKSYVNIGIAVATEKGLLVPVIKNADKKTILDIAVEITEMADKARQGKLTKEDMEGANFSISNLGGIGGTNFTPIVPVAQAAILGISRSAIKPVFVDGNFTPRNVLPLSLSYDHRLIDGADGAEFINWITQALEDPYKAILGV